MNNSLQTHFTNTLTDYLMVGEGRGADFDNQQVSYMVEGLWQTLSTHYNEARRHYHNLSHIKAMMGYFEHRTFFQFALYKLLIALLPLMCDKA